MVPSGAMSTPGSPVSRSLITTGAWNGAAAGAPARADPPAAAAIATAVAASPAGQRPHLAIVERVRRPAGGVLLRGQRVAGLGHERDVGRQPFDVDVVAVDL